MRKFNKAILAFSMAAVLSAGMVSPLNIPASGDMVKVEAATASGLPELPESTTEKWTKTTNTTVIRGKRYNIVTYTVTPKNSKSDLWVNKTNFKEKTSGINTAKKISTQILSDIVSDKFAACSVAGKALTFADIIKSSCVSGTKLGQGEIVHAATFKVTGKYIFVKSDGAANSEYRIGYQGTSIYMNDSMIIPVNKKQKDGSYTSKSVYEMTVQSKNYNSAVSDAVDFYTKKGDYAPYPSNPSLYYHDVRSVSFYLDIEKKKVTRTTVPDLPSIFR